MATDPYNASAAATSAEQAKNYSKDAKTSETNSAASAVLALAQAQIGTTKAGEAAASAADAQASANAAEANADRAEAAADSAEASEDQTTADRVQTGIDRAAAEAASAASGVVAWFDDKASLSAALATLADNVYGVVADETHDDRRYRYRVTSHAIVNSWLDDEGVRLTGNNLTTSASWDDVPEIENEAVKAQAQALANQLASSIRRVANSAAARALNAAYPETLFIAGEDGGIFRREDSDTTSAEDGGSYCGTIIRGADYATRGIFKRVNGGPLNVKWFGAKGDGTTNDTAAIQACFDSAAATALVIKAVYAPAGTYLAGTFCVPEGVEFYGDGSIETTAKAATKFKQAAEGDVIRVTGHLVGTRYFWYGKLRGFSILGDPTKTTGWGLHFKDSSGNSVAPQDTTVIEDIDIRAFPEGGARFPDGALPLTVARLKLLWNNGPGIELVGGANKHQSVHFADVSGDGNNGGLIKLISLDDRGSVLITNIKSEKRVNTSYGSVAMQDTPIVIENCTAGSVITVVGGTHISSVPDGSNFEKPGDFISITTVSIADMPHLEWSGIQIRVRPTDTGPDPRIVYHAAASIAIPYAVCSGRLSNLARVDRSQTSLVFSTFGIIDSYQNASVENPAKQIAGVTPGRSLHETDVAADTKTWLECATGGVMTWRCVDDSGVSTIYMQQRRSGGKPTETNLKRLNLTLGTALVAGDFALSSGFGNTATVTVNGASRDGRFDISVLCQGTGIGANPTITMTFKDGAYVAAPLPVVNAWNDTDLSQVGLKCGTNTTTLTMTFLGTPVTGKSYRIQGHVL